jgi:ABC-type amino acid transport substrate-binding protein
MTRDELRELIAREIAAELGQQEDRHDYTLEPDLTIPYLDQGEVDFGKIADRILSIPKIAEGIGMVVVKDISERT